MLGVNPYRMCRAALPVVLLALATTLPAQSVEQSVEQLKERLSSAEVKDKPHLCVQIAQRQLEAVDKLYASSETEKAQEALKEVVAYSELARDYAVQSHKHEKQAEIAVRGMVRKLNDIMRTL